MDINYEKRIFGLDIMRAVAILLVVFSHAIWILPQSKSLLTDLMSLAGVMGVEIFFVLSGFLIGRILYKLYVREDFNFKDIQYFWIRRWFRTLPNYYLILIVNIVLALFLGTDLPEHLGRYFLFLQNFTTEMPSFFGESWSLPIEEFAYIIGPLFLYLILFLRIKVSKRAMFLFVTLLVIAIFIITKCVYNSNDTIKDMIFWNVNLKAMTIYRIDAIYYGVLAAWLSMVFPKNWSRFKWLFLMIGGVIFVGMNIMITLKQIFIESHSFFWNVLYLPLNSIAIAFTLPLLFNIKSAAKPMLIPVTYISVISYSMYLLHYSVVLRLMKQYFPSEGLSKFGTMSYVLIYFLLTIVLSYILYRLFERPMMDIRDKESIKQRFDHRS
ncbi:MAG: acyltransferase [Flavobacteriaceae bacterium]|nr:MAG: acyltransferase [Flavobacteriaceae bacterium]